MLLVVICMFVSEGNEEVEESELDSDILLKSDVWSKRNVGVETKPSKGQQTSSSEHSSVTSSWTRPKYNALLQNKVLLCCSFRCKL